MVVKVIVIGAGIRGMGYIQYALCTPNKMKLVGVAEPRKLRANKVKEMFNLKDSQVFSDWRDFVDGVKLSDAVIITTQDQDHKEPAVAFAKRGYHILLEKPMATCESDCREIVETCEAHNVILAVCHVLKYSPQAMKIKEMIQSKVIGDVVNIQHLEPVGFWHFAHSFVRGNWRNEDGSCFSLMTKSCHDLDLIAYWMGDSRCVRVSSFGQLSHFNKDNKIIRTIRPNYRSLASFTVGGKLGRTQKTHNLGLPDGAGSRCTDCAVESTCPYSAVKHYLTGPIGIQQGNRGWPITVLLDQPDIENVTDALKTGPYGRCVYECDNDVVTHQVVNMQFDGGQTASFTMVAFTESVCKREVKVHGTMGEITCKFGGPVYHYDFRTRQTVKHDMSIQPTAAGLTGHGGADYLTIKSFVEAVEKNDPSLVSTGGKESLRSHLLVFAAEKARKENTVISPQL